MVVHLKFLEGHTRVTALGRKRNSDLRASPRPLAVAPGCSWLSVKRRRNRYKQLALDALPAWIRIRIRYARIFGCRVAELPSCRVAELPSCRVANAKPRIGFPNRLVGVNTPASLPSMPYVFAWQRVVLRSGQAYKRVSNCRRCRSAKRREMIVLISYGSSFTHLSTCRLCSF